MKFAVVTLLAGILLAAPASAQKLELKFDALAARASDKAEFDLDGALLRLATRYGSVKKEHNDKESAGDPLSGIREVHVRNYEFDQTGAYSDKDLEPLRKQLTGASGWSRVINVKEKDENTEIFLSTQGGNVTGCLIVNQEAKGLTVVHLVGTVTLAQAKDLVDSDGLHGLAAMADLSK